MSDTDETCANCGVDVDKEPMVLCDECEGTTDMYALRAAAKLALEALENIEVDMAPPVIVQMRWDAIKALCKVVPK